MMNYLLFWTLFLGLFYLLLWWVIRRTPPTPDDEKEARRVSRMLERLNKKWSRNN